MADKPPRTLQREFITSEGVDLRLALASAGERAGAFLIDAAIIFGAFIALVLLTALIMAGRATGSEYLFSIVLLVFFFLRSGYFVAFELGSRAATPGKRAMRLRVVARDGGRLSGEAVVARNALREIEVGIPFLFLLGNAFSSDGSDTWTSYAALAWVALFTFFPLFNRDRMRVGDLIAGTWVVRTPRRKLGVSVVHPHVEPGFVFTEEQLAAYGEFELQKLEEVLRREDELSLIVVAQAIQRRIGWTGGGDDMEFLQAYYAALCQRLERNMLFGKRRANKYEQA
ncbi:MAG: RDD family protein [Sphingomonas sp.]